MRIIQVGALLLFCCSPDFDRSIDKSFEKQIYFEILLELMSCKISACYSLVPESPDWSSTGIILALLLASLGIFMTLFTVLTFVRYNDTPVVKSTTRELSYIILSGNW